VNALVFADIDDEKTSQATSLNAVCQQLSVAAGVAVAGGVLSLAAGSDGHLTLSDFHIAWFVVAALAALERSAIPQAATRCRQRGVRARRKDARSPRRGTGTTGSADGLNGRQQGHSPKTPTRPTTEAETPRKCPPSASRR